MASDKVELTKKVDELSTKLLEFAENLTKFSQITNEKYEHFKKVRERTNKNSETIFDLIDMLKGHGLKLRNVESELTDINETVDERFEKVSEKLQTLSKNDKQILKVVTGNSGNIERLFNKIKGKGRESGGGGEVRDKSLVQSESEFKEDEEPTARMMELVSSFTIPSKGLLIGNQSICSFDGQILTVYNKYDGSVLREVKVYGNDWGRLSQYFNDGNVRLVLNNEIIYVNNNLERDLYI